LGVDVDEGVVRRHKVTTTTTTTTNKMVGRGIFLACFKMFIEFWSCFVL
jgi:hypothetical protein